MKHSSSKRKSALRRIGGHVRDVFIRAFPLEMGTGRGLVVQLRNRSELSVYRNIFVERVYPFETYQETLACEPAPVILDVGANAGLFAAAAFGYWPQAFVHSFEPQPTLIPRIQEMAALNGLEARHLINWCTVSDCPGTAEFFQNRNPISASLIKEKAGRRSIKRVDRVPVITLDDYARSHGLERVDLLKLDVEGVELEALGGAGEVLQRVRLIFLEVHPPFSTFSQVAKLLAATDFICSGPTPAPSDQEQANCVFCRRS